MSDLFCVPPNGATRRVRNTIGRFNPLGFRKVHRWADVAEDSSSRLALVADGGCQTREAKIERLQP
jgi:hypothetical protein